MEEEQYYSRSLVEDVAWVFSGVGEIIKLLLYSSYMVGKMITNTVTSIAVHSINFVDFITIIAQDLFVTFIDFEQELFSRICFLFFGISNLMEAFQTTLIDVVEATLSAGASLKNGIRLTTLKLLESLGSASCIPDYIQYTLRLIATAAIEFLRSMSQSLYSLLRCILISPLYFIRYCVLSPIKMVVKGSVRFAATMTMYDTIGIMIVLCVLVIIINFNLPFAIRIFVRLKDSIVSLLSFFLRKLTFIRNRFQSNSSVFTDNKGICVVCMESVVTFVCFPCRHCCLCQKCTLTLSENNPQCPMCRGRVLKFERVFIS